MNASHQWLLVLRSALVIVLASPAFLSAQQWSPQQTEVWKQVEAYWALDASGNTAGFLEYFHADYSGWSIRDPLPSDKARVQKFVTPGHQKSKTLLYDIQPVGIKIHGNVAIVHYYWTQISEKTGEVSGDKEERASGRWTDVLIKQGEKWVLIADHGGRAPEKN